MHEPKPPVIKPYTFVFSWRRFLVHCGIITVCVILGLMSWYLGKPNSIRFYETTTEDPLTTTIDHDIQIALDTRSSLSVKEGETLQAELFKGNVYFDIRRNSRNQIEVKVGNAIIKGFGTRCSIQKRRDGNNHVAVAEGYINIHLASGIYQINTYEQADFDDTSVSKHRLITDRNIAPWHSGQ